MPTKVEIEAARKAVTERFGVVAMNSGMEGVIETALVSAEAVRENVDNHDRDLLLGCRAWLWAIVETMNIDPVTSALELKVPDMDAFDSGPRVSLIDTLAQLDAISDQSHQRALNRDMAIHRSGNE